MPKRLREAREYCGSTLSEVAGFLGIPEPEIRAIECGEVELRPMDAVRLSGLVGRPAGYLRGEPLVAVEMSPVVVDLMERRNLSAGDRNEVVSFAEFLQHRASSTATRKARGGG